MTALLLLAAAWAGPQDHRLVSELQLPAEGPVILELEPTGSEHPEDLLLLDGEGTVVPSTLLDSDEAGPRRWEAASWAPLGEPPGREVVILDTRDLAHPVDRLRLEPERWWRSLRWDRGALRLGPGDHVLGVRVESMSGELLAEGLLWELDLAHERRRQDTIELPELPPGRYRVVAEHPIAWREVELSWGAAGGIEPLELELPVRGPLPDEDGGSRYEVELPVGGLELRGLELVVEDPRFQRQVQVQTVQPGEGSWTRELPLGGGEVERLSWGGAAVEHLELPVQGRLGRSIELRVDDGRDQPLEISAVRVRLRRRGLLALDAGSGPHRLYADPVLPDRRRHDLAHASVELLDARPPRVLVGGWQANPLLDPALALPERLLRGAPAELAGYRRSRTLQAPAGRLARWVLPPELLAAARAPGLPDLRVVDGEGRQLPYLLEAGELLPVSGELDRQETEQGTLLTLRFEEPVIPRRVELRGPGGPLSREVSVVDGGSARWLVDEGQPARLVLEGPRQPRQELQVLVRNGDDQPLPELSMELWSPSVELVALLPEGSAVAWYEGSGREPDYDLRLLHERLRAGAMVEGSLAEERVARVSVGSDRRWGLLGVLALGLVLAALALRLLREPRVAAAAGPPAGG